MSDNKPTNTRRVLRWGVPVDDERHLIGPGPIVDVLAGLPRYGEPDHRLDVYTLEVVDQNVRPVDDHRRQVLVVGTAHRIDDSNAYPVGSVRDQERPELVWHLLELGTVPCEPM